MKNLIDLKNEILEADDIDKINKKLEICYNDLINQPNKTNIAILYFLLKMIKEDNPLKSKILKIINLIRFPLKFTTQYFSVFLISTLTIFFKMTFIMFVNFYSYYFFLIFTLTIFLLCFSIIFLYTLKFYSYYVFQYLLMLFLYTL